ncbi:alpha,alpha-trehalose-phosphate synthase (UDP-forming) [Limimaricola hongkongensis]|uniref:Alpha,alpha-trehalose-phosphate synthase (UDP-forming) n=1 Tax=Limimaricola hongkongensis DSM 17492 TaxID=1122180 RepID=A0A017HB29_9RHOB|nr:trehalose-6-phosphate synthase [Limimaricola hongkongensis]EYD71363.1 Alpha,alpha-trehalose-phosphate synthase (UDP-forming) [Limimaricola hongkongensis DSM 17492]
MSEGRLIVVSNRIPTEAAPSGGLVVALHDALKERGGVWIGNSGKRVAPEEAAKGLTRIAADPYERYSFDLTEEEHDGFYLGYANATLWPLFHHRTDLLEVDPDQARVYREVNERVAGLIAEVVRPGDVIWVHDYHFLPLAEALRRRGVANRVGYFLHIPFPNPSDMPALPERKLMPGWLSSFDLIGLQTKRDVSNALDFLRDNGAEILLRGRLKLDDRQFEVASFPIGIDVDGFIEAAEKNADAGEHLRLSPGERLVLGVDRLDYSKGLPQRFAAFGEYLSHRPDPQVRATLLQIAPPSRENVEAYKDIRQELETITGRVNGEMAELDWTPIRYIRRNIERDVLAGLYRRGDACLVTPLADGMNLVAKEFVAAQDGADPGVLILSHFAGAAEQMDAALMVNPYDPGETAKAIDQALSMPLHERQARHLSLMQSIRETDIDWWTRTYLAALQKPIAPVGN